MPFHKNHTDNDLTAHTPHQICAEMPHTTNSLKQACVTTHLKINNLTNKLNYITDFVPFDLETADTLFHTRLDYSEAQRVPKVQQKTSNRTAARHYLLILTPYSYSFLQIHCHVAINERRFNSVQLNEDRQQYLPQVNTVVKLIFSPQYQTRI